MALSLHSASSHESPKRPATAMTGVSVTKPCPRPGRPAFRPSERDRQIVEQLAGLGVHHKDIATLITNPQSSCGISVVTLHKHFRAELDRGMAMANAKVTRALFEKATGDGPSAVRAAIWWTKCRMGWGRTAPSDGGSGQPCGVLVAPAAMTPEEWIREQEAKQGRSGHSPGRGERPQPARF